MPPKIIYLVTEDWYFVSHRLPMARAARQAGFEVHVATRVAGHGQAIEREGFILHPLAWERGSLNPLHLTRVVSEVRRLYRQLRPDLAHHVALAPTIVGSLAATGLALPCLNALAGLGFAYTSRSAKARAIRPILTALLRQGLNRAGASVLVQNPDDRRAIEALGVAAEKIALIHGSGVDTVTLQPLPEPPAPVVVGFVGRLLHDKGVAALVGAHRILQSRGAATELIVAGDADPANPASIPETLVSEWKSIPGITFLGHVKDIRAIWAKAHIAVLPSRREGLPLSLLEAAACGRPIVATDVPGCREIARADVNALLVPIDDPDALADAIERLARDADLRRRFGAASRKMAEEEFSSARIGQQVVGLYDRLLRNSRGAAEAAGREPR